MAKKSDDNKTNEVVHGGKWETHKGRSVPAGHAQRKAAHEANKKQHAKDVYAKYDATTKRGNRRKR